MPELKKAAVLRRATPEEMNRMPGKEMPESRTAGSKVFHLGVNLYQSVLYPDQVHFQDKATGKWEEIDNTLVEKEDKDGI